MTEASPNPTGQASGYARPLTPEAIDSGRHRRYVGGLWDEMGELQLNFLIAQGLQPSHRFLDVGCGALRAGIRLVDYLDEGHYYGIDINKSLIEAGYERELPDELRPKLPRENLQTTNRFEPRFGVAFDYAIAQSVFTHLALNDIRLCLVQVAKVMAPGGRFYATFFEAPTSHPLDQRLGKKSSTHNPFYYYRDDLVWAASFASWKVRYIGGWKHPRGQRMVEFRRVDPTAGGSPGRPSSARKLLDQIPGGQRLARAARSLR